MGSEKGREREVRLELQLNEDEEYQNSRWSRDGKSDEAEGRRVHGKGGRSQRD